jgi:hypothetical protein
MGHPGLWQERRNKAIAPNDLAQASRSDVPVNAGTQYRSAFLVFPKRICTLSVYWVPHARGRRRMCCSRRTHARLGQYEEFA